MKKIIMGLMALNSAIAFALPSQIPNGTYFDATGQYVPITTIQYGDKGADLDVDNGTWADHFTWNNGLEVFFRPEEHKNGVDHRLCKLSKVDENTLKHSCLLNRQTQNWTETYYYR